MNSKDTIKKLFSIAQKQQTIIEKLAKDMTLVHDPNTDYLKRSAQVAAANTGFSATDIQVSRMEGSGTTPIGGNNSITIEPSYTVMLHGAPKDNKIRQKFIDTFKIQVKNQNPGLEQNLSIQFGD
jgi:hypothetical protein